MREYEKAAVKMAVKRSIKAGTIEAGFYSLKKWTEANKEKEIIDINDVLKCFIKWAKRHQGL